MQASKASLRRTGVRSTCGPISPYSGRDCVKSHRSSYTGLYPQRNRRPPLPFLFLGNRRPLLPRSSPGQRSGLGQRLDLGQGVRIFVSCRIICGKFFICFTPLTGTALVQPPILQFDPFHRFDAFVQQSEVKTFYSLFS